MIKLFLKMRHTHKKDFSNGHLPTPTPQNSDILVKPHSNCNNTKLPTTMRSFILNELTQISVILPITEFLLLPFWVNKEFMC